MTEAVLLAGKAVPSSDGRKDQVFPLREPPPDLDASRALPIGDVLLGSTLLRRASVLIVLVLLWQAYGVYANNNLIFPTALEACSAFWGGLTSGVLFTRTLSSLTLLIQAYVIGLALALLLVAFAVSSSIGSDILSTLTAMFNPLPAIALLPLGLLWFGLGAGSILFVVVHSVLWAVALNTHVGFQSVGETVRMAGRNMGLSGPAYIFRLLIPAAFPAILSGLRIGWAFAWRTLIAAELVFGATSRSGGLGWYIFENRNNLNTPAVFAGLLTVILIGLFVEVLVFGAIEARTIKKWGMQR
ncbi:ABC transporter permease [Bradyrhizobium sp. NAS80.1]|uniref:ABC transporter permease n=1 Tax=Bradyrhizobium sp. NAS80.1 TaxID=1680159 RepID=UPI000965AF67|nr:ABC transporter permease [Bradyrhizobium sp. NAS80.1]OKO71957.1 ABC transporter permease [Bradyrhizobium sp. NAS80.1]